MAKTSLHTHTAVARLPGVSWAFLYDILLKWLPVIWDHMGDNQLHKKSSTGRVLWRFQYWGGGVKTPKTLMTSQTKIFPRLILPTLCTCTFTISIHISIFNSKKWKIIPRHPTPSNTFGVSTLPYNKSAYFRLLFLFYLSFLSVSLSRQQ